MSSSLRGSIGVMNPRSAAPTVGTRHCLGAQQAVDAALRGVAQHAKGRPTVARSSIVYTRKRTTVRQQSMRCRKLCAGCTNVSSCVVSGRISDLLIVHLSMLRQAARLAKRSVATQPSLLASIRCAAVESVCSTSGRTSELGPSVHSTRSLGLRWHTSSAPAPGTEW